MLAVVFLIAIAGVTLSIFVIRKKQMQYWLLSYLVQCCLPKERPRSGEPIHVLFCMVNHFDLGYGRASPEIQRKRMDIWLERYPKIALAHRDSDGIVLQHTWFFPPHYDHADHLKKLAELCRKGFGEIELHLHHDHLPPFQDTSQTLREKIERCIDEYSRYGIFQPKDGGRKRYGFIHGDWALDNSRHGGKYCGVNDELSILKTTGCYADFTFPSSCESQPRKINSIYYAVDEPKRPKSYNKGRDVKVGGNQWGDLMIIEGPLGLRWDKRNFGLFPCIERSAVEGFDPPTTARVDYWIKAGIHVKGKPDWVIVKVYTHGGNESSYELLLGPVGYEVFSYLEQTYNDKKRYFLHYVTARELYNIIKAAEAGEEATPGNYRDYIIPKYNYQT